MSITHMAHQAVAPKTVSGRLGRSVFGLVWPVVVQEAAWSLLSMIIMFLIGHLGATAITAVGLSEQIIFIPMTAFAGISIGATAIVARHIGAKEPEHANRIFHQAMLLAVALGIVFSLLLWFFADQLLWLFRARPEVMELGRGYIRANAAVTVFLFILYCGEAILRGAGDTRTPMIVTIVIEIVGTALSFSLINGAWFMPELGVLGAGIGRAFSAVVGATVIMVILIRGKGILKYRLRSALHFDRTDTKRILKVGLPAFGDQLQMRGAMSVYTIVISSLGTTVYAAHALAMRVEEFAFMPSFGFAVAATTLVGQALGAKDPDLAKRVAYLTQRYCVIAMTSMGVLTFIFSEKLISIFVSDPEVIRVGALGLKIWAFAMPGMATNQSLAGGLRGAGDTGWVFLLTTIGMWTMRIGGGAILVFLFNLGAPGAWAGAVLDHNVRAVLMWWRFRGGKWKTIEV